MFRKVSIFLALSAMTLLPIFNRPSTAQSTREGKKPAASKRPVPPKRIPPNKVKPGGGLDYSIRACESEESSLTALVPVENPVLTTQSYPSFLFYIPDPASAISYGEFSLFTASEKTRIYSTKINIKDTPGIIKIDLPNSPQYALETEQPYHWYFKLYCQTETDTPVYLDVDGWVRRVPTTSNTTEQIETASPVIWYDAIAIAAQNLIATPQDPIIQSRWLELLQFIEQEYLANTAIQSVTTENSNSSLE